MADKAKVLFDPNGGFITLTVVSGPPCLGSFNLLYKILHSPEVNVLYPEVVKLVHDSIEDSYPLPFGFHQISNLQLRIVGRYGPLPTKNVIGVSYIFSQGDAILNVVPAKYNIIKKTVSTTFERFVHTFEFKSL